MGVLSKIKDTMALVSKRCAGTSIRKTGLLEYDIVKKILADKKESFIRVEARLMFYKQLKDSVSVAVGIDKEDNEMISEDISMLEVVRSTLELEVDKMNRKLILLERLGYKPKSKDKS